MNNLLEYTLKALKKAYSAQTETTDAWHATTPCSPATTDVADFENLHNIIIAQHLRNFNLWHVEDKARVVTVDDSAIAKYKRKIDGLNQQRNDLIEKVDACLVSLMQPKLPATSTKLYNTETIGMAIDRLSILALKVFHMHEQTIRTDVDAHHIVSCQHKLEVLQQQRSDLLKAIEQLLAEYFAGTKTPLLYHQFKMYNDPTLNPELYTKEK